MSKPKTLWIVCGSLVFLVLAPGTVAGVIPYSLTGWRMGGPFMGVTIIPFAGALLVVAGLASLLDSFARFVFEGVGTPAPVAPPRHLVVSGQYRYVRNPMYVAVLFMVVGQSLVLGSVALLRYAAVLWIIFHTLVILYEEPKLVSQFGASYQAYCRNVRRWWPRVRRWNS
ncbi:MAG: isoprenylcysteine carboxylmethyltransferase family protein [Proteobacteria bacterium]|nr:isoprenylcysteine carboxylmethyltransferase family protein [Pseudomonadota bacterium]